MYWALLKWVMWDEIDLLQVILVRLFFPQNYGRAVYLGNVGRISYVHQPGQNHIMLREISFSYGVRLACRRQVRCA